MPKPKRLLILGAGIMQGPALRTAKAMGLETAAVDGDPRAPCAALADFFECIDLKDEEGITAFARTLQAEGDLSGVMTAGTDFSASVAYVAERLGLPGIPYEAALNASDKERMRRCFKAAGVPSPRFLILHAPGPGEKPRPLPPPPWGCPAVVKPVDNMGGRGCRRVDSPEDLAPAVTQALRCSRSGRAILEEYMEGPEFSVDALVYDGELTLCGFADRHIFFPPSFIEMGHTMPSTLDQEEQRRILAVFAAGVRALGITRGAAKGDLKLTPQGPMIGEIAARLSGGYMSGWTYPYASGVNPTRGAILLALGKKPEGMEPLWHWTSAERAFISIPGRARSLRGFEKAWTAPWVKDLFLRVKAGDRLRFPENNVEKCGNLITAAPTREVAVHAAEGAARSIAVRLEAPDPETDAFLAPGPFRFPGPFPNAFPVPPTLEAPLDALPEPWLTSTGTPSASTGLPIDETSSDGAFAAGPALLPAAAPDFFILPFPEFTESGFRDYMGRSVAETLGLVRDLTGLPLPLGQGRGRFPLGRSFWAAVIRGGCQGGAYVVDRLVKEITGRGASTQ